MTLANLIDAFKLRGTTPPTTHPKPALTETHELCACGVWALKVGKANHRCLKRAKTDKFTPADA